MWLSKPLFIEAFLSTSHCTTLGWTPLPLLSMPTHMHLIILMKSCLSVEVVEPIAKREAKGAKGWRFLGGKRSI